MLPIVYFIDLIKTYIPKAYCEKKGWVLRTNDCEQVDQCVTGGGLHNCIQCTVVSSARLALTPVVYGRYKHLTLITLKYCFKNHA